MPTSYTDPSTLFGSLVTFAGAVLALVVAFGLDLSAEQVERILAALAAAGPLVTAWLIRRKAYAPATVDKLTGPVVDAG